MESGTGRRARPAPILSGIELVLLLGLIALIAIVTLLPLGDHRAAGAPIPGPASTAH